MVVRSFQTVATLTCLKTLVVLFNIVFVLSGLLLLILGIWLHVEMHKYMEVSTEISDTAPYILMGTGGFILLIGILACCCTYKEQPIFLYAYAVILGIVFIVEIGACISGYAYRSKLGESFQKGLTASINAYGIDYPRTSAVNNMQTTLHCCGVSNYVDWSNTPYKKIPGSCCKAGIAGIGCDTTKPYNIYTEGCYSLINNWFASKLSLVAGAALGLACFQIFGIFVAISLAKLLRKTQYEQIES